MSCFLRPIFLVEDNPLDIDLTRRAFEKRRLSNPLKVARDGEEALTYVAQWKPEEPLPILILLDLKLPKLNGLEVLKSLKTNEQWHAIPVTILTTSSENSDIKTAYQLGANSYIVKPVNFEKFLEVVAQIELYWGILNTLPK